MTLPSPENWQSALTQTTPSSYQERAPALRSMGYFLLFWLIILACTSGLFLPVKFALRPLSLKQAAIPPCWEQTVRPTYYNAFLKPGMTTSTNPAFLVEPVHPLLFNSGYTAAPQLDNDPSRLNPHPNPQLRPTTGPSAPPDLPGEGSPDQAGACSIWQA